MEFPVPAFFDPTFSIPPIAQRKSTNGARMAFASFNRVIPMRLKSDDQWLSSSQRCGGFTPLPFSRIAGTLSYENSGIRDFKVALQKRLLPTARVSPDFIAAVELTAHQLNHQTRRCLNGRTACAVFHDAAARLRWTKPQRQTIFRLLLQQFGAITGMLSSGDHRSPATLWRVTVESWLRRQGLISVRQKQNVSTTSPKIWSHN